MKNWNFAETSEFPEESELPEDPGTARSPTTYLTWVSCTAFYNHHRVITDDEKLRDARLVLMQAVKITIKNALTMIGVKARRGCRPDP